MSHSSLIPLRRGDGFWVAVGDGDLGVAADVITVVREALGGDIADEVGFVFGVDVAWCVGMVAD